MLLDSEIYEKIKPKMEEEESNEMEVAKKEIEN
jgi:hypothetical protein